MVAGKSRCGFDRVSRNKLIDVYAEKKVALKLKKRFIRNAKFWEAVGCSMREAGYTFSDTACENEMGRLLDTFKKIFDNDTKSGRAAAKFWVHYDKLYLHLGKSVSMRPKVLVAAGTSNWVKRNGLCCSKKY